MLFHCLDTIKANKKTIQNTETHISPIETHTHTQLPNIKTVTYRHTSIP